MQGHILAIILTGVAVTQFGAAQTFSEYPVPAGISVYGIAAGPDGALWFTEGLTEANSMKIGRLTTSGTVTEFTVPPPSFEGGYLTDITRGPDGALWFGEIGNLGRIDTAGNVRHFQSGGGPQGNWIQTGPDGALWHEATSNVARMDTSGNYSAPYGVLVDDTLQGLGFGQDGSMWVTVQLSPRDSGNLRRLTLAGQVTAEYTVLSGVGPITLGPDGAMWFETGSGLGRIGANGEVTTLPIHTSGSISDLISGPDGALWFTEPYANKLGRVTTDGVLTEYTPPPAPSGLPPCLYAQYVGPFRITVGPDGALWFTEPCANRIGRFAPAAQSVSWTVTGSHVGNFSAAQPTALFTITVTNPVGSGPSSGPVTVTEFPPANVTSVAMSGVNWQCSGTLCTRSDALPVGSSYPPITVAVTLASDSSTQMSNQVSVGGGGLSQASA
ncbi:MAG TPA: hypothetical protein VKU19_38555, partial [Bryobacteraceae bacterium]|nr:hypothetical protein [Bryobacteraceae bacterium]